MSDTPTRTSRLLSLLPDALRNRLGDGPRDESGDERDFLFQSEAGRSSRKSNARLLMSRLVPMLPESMLKRLARGGGAGLGGAGVVRGQ